MAHRCRLTFPTATTVGALQSVESHGSLDGYVPQDRKSRAKVGFGASRRWWLNLELAYSDERKNRTCEFT